jgi:hypothetical protein
MSAGAHRHAIGAAVLACAATLLATAPAGSAAPTGMPKPGAQFNVFDHRTAGDGWHLEMTVGTSGDSLSQLVLYSERCNELVTTRHVPIRSDGSIASSGPFPARHRQQGTWRLDASWTDADHVTGSFQLTTPGCDGGLHHFTSRRQTSPGEHVHLGYGTPAGSYPNLGAASRRARAQARRLWSASRREAKRRFGSYRRVLALGYTRYRKRWKRPLLFHVRHRGFQDDNRRFDATRPESLVYWWPENRGPILIAFMYRSPRAGGWPAFAKPLLGWHLHGNGKTLMTHVWMTNYLRSGIANCMPARALEAANPRLRFRPASQPAVLASRPCPEPGP